MCVSHTYEAPQRQLYTKLVSKLVLKADAWATMPATVHLSYDELGWHGVFVYSNQVHDYRMHLR